ncbi:nitroreductase family protein [Aromatoleum toluolicum]|uniref:Nitroreductase n=1 Tax=Aromatoleum toluolicum TaxID=90060 RepID=A0ABX1NNW1_9RHOO|nr:nitroreductase family protein [Aromatoleum toluolicum]NMG01035.1 nitroreductase family protein [Aromatoleum toluolicum]
MAHEPAAVSTDSGKVAAVRAYHEHSKHRPERYAPGPGRLDWANQPDPWRSWDGAARTILPLAADGLATRYAALRRGELPPPAPFDLEHIGILFELSLALSAWKEFGGSRWALRCNPSSGNLHPTEGYLIAPALPGLPAGVHHYLSRDHVLEQRAAPREGWDAAFGGQAALVALSSIHWREAWKYGMRAWRYCQHDCGHAIAAVSVAAAALGWSARVLDGVGDDDIARLAGLDRVADFDGAEREAPEVLLQLGAAGSGTDVDALRALADQADWRGRANRLSSAHVDWPDIAVVDAAARKPRTAAAEAPAPAALPPSAAPVQDLSVATLARRRRSAVAFDGVTAMTAETFFAVLDALLPRAGVPPWSAWPWPPQVHPALFVHRVDGLEAGLYVLVRDPAALAGLRGAMRADWLWHKSGPAHLPLYLLIPYDLRATAQLVCCHQEIAADSCFALGMLARTGLVAHEPWRYAPLYRECGLLGQVLYLEAEAAGLSGTGIGCFFDDAMHELLGLAGEEWQSLYHFTVGGPVEDSRLSSLPPYGAARRVRTPKT